MAISVTPWLAVAVLRLQPPVPSLWQPTMRHGELELGASRLWAEDHSSGQDQPTPRSGPLPLLRMRRRVASG
jgi:hypothetical protein